MPEGRQLGREVLVDRARETRSASSCLYVEGRPLPRLRVESVGGMEGSVGGMEGRERRLLVRTRSSPVLSYPSCPVRLSGRSCHWVEPLRIRPWISAQETEYK